MEETTDNDKLKPLIQCPTCNTTWNIDIIKRYTGATPEEVNELATMILCVCPFIFFNRSN